MTDMPEPVDTKYIVFKRDEFHKWWDSVTEIMARDEAPDPLPDAVVLRRQDLFAGPALHVYAHCISMVANFSDKKHLQKVADYFHEQAVVADAEGWKLPD